MRIAGALRLTAAAVLLLPSGGKFLAAWSPYPDANLPVTVGPGNQEFASSAPDGAGGLLVAWEDSRSGTDLDIYAQRIDAAGNPLWDPDGIVVIAAAENQQSPVILPDGAGRAFVLWEDKRDGAYFDIYAQRLDGAGNLLWDPGGVLVCGATASQYKPAAATDGSGGLIAAWYDWRSTVDTDIYAQRLGPDGVALWTADGVPVSTFPGRQQFPAITSDGAGGALVVWEDRRVLGEYDIYIQRIDPSGLALWIPNGTPVTDAVKDQMFPSLTGDGAGGAVVAWEDWRSTNHNNIFAQRIDSNGNSLWGGNGVSVTSAADDQYEPIVQREATGSFLIAWEDWRSTTDADVYVQRLDGYGVAAWTADGLPVAVGSGRQQYPRLAGDGEGGAVVAWHDTPPLSDTDVRGQWIDATGLARCPSAGLLLTNAAGDQKFPLAVGDGEGGAIVAWEDGRSVDTDLYAQRFFRDFDGEGLTDCFEAQLGTDPGLADTDGDGFTDYEEIAYDGDDSSYSPGADLDPLSPDTDGDLAADGVDCLPLNGTVWGAPGEVSGVTLAEATLLRIQWVDQASSAGPATVYDILYGLLSDLRQTGSFASASCRAGNLSGPPFEEIVEDPPVGDGWFFLLRAENPCGVGTFGNSLRDATATTPCP